MMTSFTTAQVPILLDDPYYDTDDTTINFYSFLQIAVFCKMTFTQDYLHPLRQKLFTPSPNPINEHLY